MPRKYFFNIEKIKKDSHEKFYWLGFLAGDGSVQEQGRRLRIELKNDSLDILNHFRDFMESNVNITSRINNNGCHCSRMDINSKELGNYLAEYNIVPNKTRTFEIPEEKIPEEYKMDFIRGFMDADGCIHIRKERNNAPSLSFVSGSKKCIEQIKNILNITNQINQQGNNYILNKEGKEVISILNKIYEHSTEETRLKRKYDIYCTIIK